MDTSIINLEELQKQMDATVKSFVDANCYNYDEAVSLLQRYEQQIQFENQQIKETQGRIHALQQSIEANSTLISQSIELDKEQQDILDSLPNDIELILNQTLEERRKLQGLRKEYRAVDDQNRHNLADWEKRLEQYKVSLGLTIVSEVFSDGDPTQKVVFRYIDPSAIEQEYYFTFKVVKNRYEGIECQPYIPVFRELLEYVNMGRLSMAGVLCLMRHKFRKHALESQKY